MVVHRKKKSSKKKGRMHRLGLRRRGSGNRGGFGRAGHGKRAGHKAQKYGKLVSKGFSSKTRKKLKAVNVSELNAYDKSVELKDTKVLGKGTLKKKLQVKAASFSKKAKEKIKKAGGVCIEV
jgi:ribosomal protein L18E